MLRKHDLTERLRTTVSNLNPPASKLNDFINYLADNYSSNERGDISLEEAIFIAKKQIGESVIDAREKQGIGEQDGNLLCNDNTYGANGNWTVGFFLKHPRDAVQYLLVQAKQQALRKGDAERASKFGAVADGIQDARHAYDTFSFFKGNRTNDMVNIERRYIGGSNAVDAAFNSNKAGFFDRIFHRTSREYKDFEKEFKAYREGSKVEFGTNSRDANRESVERTAKAYLRHKIPGWDGKGLPTLEQINQLRGKSKNRALLCFNVLSATKDSAETEQKLKSLETTIENQMLKDGTNVVTDKLYNANSIDPSTIKGLLNDVSPIKKIVGLDGATRTQELTDKQKLFQKGLAKDLEDKPNGVDVQRLSKDAYDLELEPDDLNMSMDN